MLPQQTMDAVVTWVDGSDLKHQNKLLERLKSSGISQSKIDPARFYSSDEISYCIKLLLKNAPWLRTIYIVTDAQRPKIFEHIMGTKDAARVKLVDHKEIFHDFEDYLPTFNSLAIETMLWRIPNLSENFIYCNDDIFIIRPVQETDFFQESKLVVRGQWDKQHASRWLRFLHKSPDAHRSLQERSALLAGYTKYFLHLPHAPFALKKSLFADFFAQHLDLLQTNINYPLRDANQFWPISLIQHLAFKNHQAILDNSKQSIMINGAHHTQNKQNLRLKKIFKNDAIKFLCMQGMEVMTPNRREEIWRLFENELQLG